MQSCTSVRLTRGKGLKTRISDHSSAVLSIPWCRTTGGGRLFHDGIPAASARSNCGTHCATSGFPRNALSRTPNMAETARQKRVTGRVMHEFKHGELKSGPGGKGGKVKSRRQAIAIALKETGGSKYESEKENKKDSRGRAAKKRAAKPINRYEKASPMWARAAVAKAVAQWADGMRQRGRREGARLPKRERVAALPRTNFISAPKSAPFRAAPK